MCVWGGAVTEKTHVLKDLGTDLPGALTAKPPPHPTAPQSTSRSPRFLGVIGSTLWIPSWQGLGIGGPDPDQVASSTQPRLGTEGVQQAGPGLTQAERRQHSGSRPIPDPSLLQCGNCDTEAPGGGMAE